MEYAFSLIHRINVLANSVVYRQNLDDQLVCPECYEQVFNTLETFIGDGSDVNSVQNLYGILQMI